MAVGNLGGSSSQRPGGRVIVIAGDGMSPELAAPWMAAGHLPNLQSLADAGCYAPLATTNPAESPVAWASFISGKNPGKHGIFDFLHRDPRTYLPKLAAITVTPRPFGAPAIRANRQGDSLWRILSDGDRRCTVLRVPTTFPPEPINGRLLSGLGIPDLRGTWGTSILYGDRLADDSGTEMGGQTVHLRFEDDRAESRIAGPKGTSVPLRLRADRAGRRLHIRANGHEITLRERQWTDWLPLTFRVSHLVPVHGICRFHLKAIDDERIELYQSPLHWHPERPVLPISAPADFARDAVRRQGLFGTLGWQEDTWGLNEGRLDDDEFLHHLHRVFDEHRQLTLNALHDGDFDFFISVFESTDRVAHMFMRTLDPAHPLYSGDDARRHGTAILDVYRRFDEVVGDVRALLDPVDTLIVMSDHGFHPVRAMVNLNSWLADHGFLCVDRDAAAESRRMSDLFGGGGFWPGVDWSKSRAYALGLSKIYVNLAGREAAGIVSPGREYQETCRAIAEGLRTLRDPATGGQVLRNVYTRTATFKGPASQEAGDLVVGFNSGYRTSWQTSLGGVPPTVIEPNGRRWSGDHCSLDPGLTSGVLLSNRRLAEGAAPHITDLAPTILSLLGVPVPADMDGRTLEMVRVPGRVAATAVPGAPAQAATPDHRSDKAA